MINFFLRFFASTFHNIDDKVYMEKNSCCLSSKWRLFSCSKSTSFCAAQCQSPCKCLKSRNEILFIYFSDECTLRKQIKTTTKIIKNKNSETF